MSEGSRGTDGADGAALEELLGAAEASISRLDERFDGLDDLEGGLDDLAETFDDDEIEAIVTDLEDVVAVVDELEDVLGEVDLAELPEAVDAGEVLEAIEVGEIPEALADDDADLGDAVAVRHLLSAIDLTELWDAANVRGLWQEKRDLDDAVDDVTDAEGDDDGLLSEAADAVTDDDGLLDDDGWVDADFGSGDVGPSSGAGFGGEGGPLADGDAQEYQVLIQQQAFEGIGAFREALLKTHATFDALYQANREKMRRQDTSTNSRNPTAASTLATRRRDVGGHAGEHSTVPRKVKYSTAPSRRRIYGRRFEQEIEKRRQELDEKRERRDGGDGE